MSPKPIKPGPPDDRPSGPGASAARIRQADAERAFSLARQALGGESSEVRLVDDGRRAEFAFLGIEYAICERQGQGVLVSFLVDEADRATLPGDTGLEPDPVRFGWFRSRLGKDPARWRSTRVESLVGRTLTSLRALAELGRWPSLAASGAPFVAVPRSLARGWSAADAAAALAAPGPTVLVDRPGGHALVMHGIAPVYLHHLRNGALLVRVTTRASAEASRLRELVAEVPERVFQPVGRTLVVEEPLWIFDGGAEGRTLDPEQVLVCDLAPGRYGIDAGRHDAGGGLILSLVRLLGEAVSST